MSASTIKIVIGALLIAAGALLLPLLLLRPVAQASNEEVVFRVPGRASLEAEAPGTFYLWHQFHTLHRGERFDRHDALPDGLRIELRHAATGKPLELEPLGNISTEFGDEASRSIGHVEVTRPGTIVVEVSGGDDVERVFSLSRFSLGPWLRGLGLSALALLAVGGAGIVLVVLGVSQRADRQR